MLCQIAIAKPNFWQQRTYNDLRVAHHYLLVDSAGGADRQNPQFSDWLELGYQRAKLLAKQVDSASSYNLVMNRYANGFNDAHLQYRPYLKRFAFQHFWPGFMIYYQNKNFYVSTLAYDDKRSHLPPSGAKLISCNGIKPQILMQQRVFPYFGNQYLAASWFINTPRLLIYQQNPWFKALRYCQFAVQQKIERYQLKWYKITTSHAFNLRQLASYYYRSTTKTAAFTPQGVWVSLPTFFLTSSSQQQRMRQVIAQAKSWRGEEIIVFDLRGNTGGNSMWGTELLQALYGKAYFQQQMSSMPLARHQWRVSPGNIAELSHFYLPTVKKSFGVMNAETQALKDTLQGMKTALQHQQLYFPKMVSRASTITASTDFVNPVKAGIYFLTDGRCVSACLDFVDQLSYFPHVIQIGQQTNADTDYTEVRVAKLPSGARLSFPMKVHRYRKRKSNQAYLPQGKYYYFGDINNTQKLKNWLLHLLSA